MMRRVPYCTRGFLITCPNGDKPSNLWLDQALSAVFVYQLERALAVFG